MSMYDWKQGKVVQGLTGNDNKDDDYNNSSYDYSYENHQQPETAVETPETSPGLVPTDKTIYGDKAKEVAANIFDPLIKGAETELEGVDVAAQQKIKGLESQIPYMTRQFESYAAKSGLGTGMQMRQMNELMTNISGEAANIYGEAEMAKFGIKSKMAGYESAMAQGEYELATDMYNQSLSESQFAADYLGQDFIQPEVKVMYEQMSVADSIINDPTSTEAQVLEAQKTYDTFETQLKESGYSGDVGEGIKTFQQQQQALQDAYVEAQQQIADDTLEYEMFSQLDTIHAFRELQGGKSLEEVMSLYPLADMSEVIEYYQEIAGTDATFGPPQTTGTEDYNY